MLKTKHEFALFQKPLLAYYRFQFHVANFFYFKLYISDLTENQISNKFITILRFLWPCANAPVAKKRRHYRPGVAKEEGGYSGRHHFSIEFAPSYQFYVSLFGSLSN